MADPQVLILQGGVAAEAQTEVLMSSFLSVLSLVPPRFTKVPVDQIGVSGGVVSFVCQAAGDPKPRVSWNKKGKKVNSQRIEVSPPAQVG